MSNVAAHMFGENLSNSVTSDLYKLLSVAFYSKVLAMFIRTMLLTTYVFTFRVIIIRTYVGNTSTKTFCFRYSLRIVVIAKISTKFQISRARTPRIPNKNVRVRNTRRIGASSRCFFRCTRYSRWLGSYPNVCW